MTSQESPAPTATTVADRSQEFVAVEGGEETASAGTLLVVAYLLMWAALLAFVFMTWRRQRQLEDKLSRLESDVSKATRE